MSVAVVGVLVAKPRFLDNLLKLSMGHDDYVIGRHI